jgi:hypothetical protein
MALISCIISKILPTAPFTLVGVTMEPVSSQNTQLSTYSKNPAISLVTYATGVKGKVGRIFDIAYSSVMF